MVLRRASSTGGWDRVMTRPDTGTLPSAHLRPRFVCAGRPPSNHIPGSKLIYGRSGPILPNMPFPPVAPFAAPAGVERRLKRAVAHVLRQGPG
jgi:hypothetical protein